MYKVTSVCVFALVLSAPSISQQLDAPDPRAVLQLEQQRLKRAEEERALQESTPIVPEIIVQEQSVNLDNVSDAKNIPLRNFDVNDSEYLSAIEIAQVLDPYLGSVVSLKDLTEATEKINQLYKSKNVSTARAVLPPQDINQGVVKIQLIEARLGVINVSGVKHLRSDFVKQRIHLNPGDLISVAQIEKDFVRFNNLYDSKLRANISAGAEIGETNLNVEVIEQNRTELRAFADNAGGDSVGHTRGGIIFRTNNLRGVSDTLQLLATGTQGSNSYGISYAMPVSTSDTRFDISYTSGDIKLVNGAFVPLDITGESKDFSLGLTKPLADHNNEQWSLYGRISSRTSTSRFSGLTQQKQDLLVESIGLSGTARGETYAWSLDGSLNYASRQVGSDEGFVYYRGNASRVDSINDHVQLLTRGNVQYSFDSSPPSGEQFQLGGSYTVRGYSEGLLSGRDGFVGSVELRETVYPKTQSRVSSQFIPQVQLLMFFEAGAVYSEHKELNSDKYLSSFGAGAIFSYGSKVSARFSAAVPLRNVAESLDQDNIKLLFSLNIDLF